MKTFIAATFVVAGMAVAAPAFAQGIYVGPGGVGVDSGLGYGYGHRHYRDDSDYAPRRHRGDYYEGRSVSPGYGHRNYFYDHY